MDDPITTQITREVAGWEGVTPFPVRVRERLVAEHRALPHHILPDSGWVSVAIQDASDVAAVIALFRLNYERPWVSGQAASE
jgi:hypothetical protein